MWFNLAEGWAVNWLSSAFGPDSMMGWLITLCLVSLWLVSWHRRQRAAKKPGMASWYFIIPCFVVAALAIAAGAYGLGLQGRSEAKAEAPVVATHLQLGPAAPEKAKPKFVINEQIGASYSANPSPQPAIQYQGTFAANLNWLKVYVDILQGGPAQYRRLKITELKDYARGQSFNIPILIREDAPNDTWIFKWGESSEKFRADGGFMFYARIALIGESNDEQYFYFMIVPNQINGRPYIMVINEGQMNFRREWEQFDARK